MCGYLLCRLTPLKRALWEPVETLVYFFLFPVLLFHSIIKRPLDLVAASNLVAAGWSMGLTGIALALSIPLWPGLRRFIDRREHAASAQVAFRFNSFIGLALAERLAGAPGLQYQAILIGVCVPLCNVAAVLPMARHSQSGALRELVRNPLIIATAFGLCVNLLGLRLPTWLEPSVSRIGSAALPLGLLAAGAGMNFLALGRAKALAAALLLIRHLLLPLVALAMCRLFHLSPAQTTVLLIFSALPTSSSCYVLASRMGYDAALVAALVTLSTVLGILSLPLAIGLLPAL